MLIRFEMDFEFTPWSLKKVFCWDFFPFMYNLLAQSIVHKKMHRCDHTSIVSNIFEVALEFCTSKLSQFFLFYRGLKFSENRKDTRIQMWLAKDNPICRFYNVAK